MTEPDREFQVNMMRDHNNVGILASVRHCLFHLQKMENCEVEKKRKIELKMKNVEKYSSKTSGTKR